MICALALCLQAVLPAAAEQAGVHTSSGVAVASIDIDDKYLEGVDINDDPSYIKFVKNQQQVGLTDFNALVTHQKRFNAFNKLYGIDVSVYNGDIDFEKVKAEGYQFVIVRAGARGYGAEGNMIEDKRFEEHVDNAHKAGLMVGAYYYTQAVNKEEVKQEAEVTLKKIGGRKLEMPVYFDIEPAYDWNGKAGRLVAAKLSKEEKAELCQYYCDLINDAGYDSGVTSCKSWFEWEINMSMLENSYDIWLAHYTNSTNYSNDYNMWQFSSARKVEGVYSARTDQDVRYVDQIRPYGSQKLTFTTDAEKVQLKWKATVNTLGYIVYKNDASGKAVKLGTTKDLTFTVPREQADTTYYIKSYNILDETYYYSDSSNTVTVSGLKLSGIKTVNVTDSSVELKWTPTNAANGYCIYMNDKLLGYSNSAKYTVNGLKAETKYKFSICAFFNSDSSTAYSAKSKIGTYSDAYYVTTLKKQEEPAPTPTPEPTPSGTDITTTELAGSNRFETAVLISKKCFPNGAKTVVIVSGETYADALVSAPLANSFNAPVLLTAKSGLDDATLKEIQRLGAKSAYIVGGDGVIAKTVDTVLTEKGLNVHRVFSSYVPDRYGTAVYVAANMDIARGTTPSTVFIAYANGYADTLTVGSIASVKDAPILYINSAGILDGSTKYYLNSIKGTLKNIYIIGGDKVISTQAEATLAEYGKVERISGSNRYETCLEVNKFFASDLTGKGVCVTTGLNYPDALAGGVLAAKNKAPVVIADTALTASQKNYLTSRNPSELYKLGGAGISVSAVQVALSGK